MAGFRNEAISVARSFGLIGFGLATFFAEPVVLDLAEGFDGSEVGSFDAAVVALHVAGVVVSVEEEGG